MTTGTTTLTDANEAPTKAATKRKPRQSAPVQRHIGPPGVPQQSASAADAGPTEAGLNGTGAGELSAIPDARASKQPAKSTAVLKLLRRKRGATVAEMVEATGWQAHSVRGFLSGTVKKRMGLEVASEVGADGIRRYSVAKV